MSAVSRSSRSFSDHLLNHCLSFPRYNMVTGVHGACSWNRSVWIQWCVGTEDNYFLRSTLGCWDVSLRLCHTGWLRWFLKDCISGVPSPRLAKQPATLRSPCPSVPVCYQVLWFTQQAPATLPVLGLPPDLLVKGHGLQRSTGTAQKQGNGHGSCHDLGVFQHNWGTILAFSILNRFQSHCGTFMWFLCKGKLAWLLFLL